MARAKTRNTENLTQLNVEISKELKKQLANLAFKKDTSIKAIVAEALNAYVEGRTILK